MIVSRTPLRVSFVGGGSDIDSFYRSQPGAVLSTAINKFIYITVNKKFDRKIRASYSITEIVDRVDQIQNELIQESLKLVGLDAGVEITSISDIPSEGTGLGSSSAYTVGLLNALYAHLGVFAGAERLAEQACNIEIERCGKPIGKQDQYIAAYGGFQYIQFNSDGSVYVDPVICRPETKRKLHAQLLMLYTGLTRSADDVLREQKSNTAADENRRATMGAMVKLAGELRDALTADDVDSFGQIMHQGWMLKRQMASSISNPMIDGWYDRARAHGAEGGKILGAGGGGFLLLCAPPEKHAGIASALPELRPVSWGLEPQGSKIIYVEEGV